MIQRDLLLVTRQQAYTRMFELNVVKYLNYRRELMVGARFVSMIISNPKRCTFNKTFSQESFQYQEVFFLFFESWERPAQFY